MQPVRIILKALTAEMDMSFRGNSLEVRELPFRIGRECRDKTPAAPPPGLNDRRGLAGSRTNDLYIVEPGPRLFISRQHLLIEKRENGYVLVDLFSACGTIVEGRYIGGDHNGGEANLEHEDVVIIGTAGSPYVFKVLML